MKIEGTLTPAHPNQQTRTGCALDALAGVPGRFFCGAAGSRARMATKAERMSDTEFSRLLDERRREFQGTRKGRSVRRLSTWMPGEHLCESPVERQFYRHALPLIDVSPQVESCGYRLDFAVGRLAIEIDGHDFHKSIEQRTRDAARDRRLLRDGWTVIRFTGSEIWADVDGCVAEVVEIMKRLTD